MKKITFSAVALAAMSTMMFAGGDIKPVTNTEPITAVEHSDDSDFYVGLGYTSITIEEDAMYGAKGDGVLLNAGYQYNPYLAIEARYSTTVGDMDATGAASPSSNYKLNNLGLYIKPMIQMEQISLYALLGYGKLSFTDFGGTKHSENAFQWGIGAGYDINKNLSLQLDYVSFYDDTNFGTFSGNIESDAVSVSVNYKF